MLHKLVSLFKEIEASKQSFAPFLPHIILGIWLVLIGAGIRQHTARAVQPPIYDALTYFQKAKNFWGTVYEGKLVNPFNIAPSFRPPGTIVMSYPLGFSTDFRPFYFRSVFLPILCVVFAVYAAGYSRIMGNSEKWDLACLAMFLTTIPMFHHFERAKDIPSPLIWGLVDNFLAGVAALSVAFFLRSVKYLSLKWLLVAAFLSSFCLFVKPSGSLVMGLTAATWVLGMLFRLKTAEDAGDRKQIRKLLIIGTIAVGFIYLAAFCGSMFSGYLSLENLSFGKAAIRVMHDEMKLTPDLLLKMIRISFGYVLPLLLFLTWGIALIYWNKMDLSETNLTKGLFVLLVAASFLYLAVGVWFWIFVSGGITQIRYFFPFSLMATIAIVPVFLRLVKNLQSSRKVIVQTLLLVPALNILMLLSSADPSVAWQKWSGVNLSTGTHRDEVEQAKRLITDLKKEGKNVFLYSLHSDASTSAFESVGAFEAVMNPSEPVFLTRLPVDWQRPAVIRLDDLLTSDYVIFTPIRNASQKTESLAQKSPQDFWQEQLLFHGLFTELTDKDGVKVVSETTVRLLKIVDRKRLSASLSEKLKNYSWRPVFVEANPDRWISRRDLADVLKGSAVAIRDVLYGKRYMVHALSLSRTKDDIILKVWWEQMQSDADKEWYLFCHLIDDKGNILYNQQVLLANRIPPKNDRAIQFDTMIFGRIDDARLSSLAFGVYSPPSSAFLHADTGARDWDNRRVIVTLPKN